MEKKDIYIEREREKERKQNLKDIPNIYLDTYLNTYDYHLLLDAYQIVF